MLEGFLYTAIPLIFISLCVYVTNKIRKKCSDRRMKEVSECSLDWYHFNDKKDKRKFE